MNDHIIALSRGLGAAHYLCGWCTSDDPPDDKWQSIRDSAHQVPVWLSTRDKAVVYDEQAARDTAEQLRARYRYPASGIRISAEALKR